MLLSPSLFYSAAKRFQRREADTFEKNEKMVALTYYFIYTSMTRMFLLFMVHEIPVNINQGKDASGD